MLVANGRQKLLLTDRLILPMKSNPRRKAKKSKGRRKADSIPFWGFDLSLSKPLYDRDKKMVQKLAGVAWHINRVHIFKTELSDLPSMSVAEEKLTTTAEFLQSVSLAELSETTDLEAQEKDWLNRVITKPELRSATMMVLEWYKTGHSQALKKSAQALELYGKELSGWNTHKLVCLCVLIACDSFELADPDMSRVTAEMLWERALEMYQRIRQQASQPDTERRDISKVNRTKVYKDLGIQLKFPPGFKKNNAANSPIA